MTLHLQNTMAQHNENAPAQNLPLLTLDEIVPTNYNITIGNNNPRIDFNKLRVPEDSSRILKDILLAHPCKDMLTKSTSVPTCYIHQFWSTTKVNLDDESFTVTLERQEYTVDLDVLRTVLMLPTPKEFQTMMTSLKSLII